MKFLIRSVYDALPSPANLATWGLCEDRVCKLSGQNGNPAHILSECTTTLTQGCNGRRHDKVLEIIADVLEKEKKTRPRKCPNHGISFVKVGETKRRSLLNESQWEMRVDLRKKLVFPEIVQTRYCAVDTTQEEDHCD